MMELMKLPSTNEVIISPDESLMFASQSDKNNALTTLFIGLTNAITKHECHIDISYPMNIKVSK